MAGIERKTVDRMVEGVSKPDFSLPVFANCIVHLHPTYQQSIMRAFMETVVHWNHLYTIGHYDIRSEGTILTAARITEALEQSPILLPYIPNV